MRIGLVIDHFDPGRGGAEQWTWQHARQLLARGHEVHVVARDVGAGVGELPVVVHCLGHIHTAMGRAEAAERELRRLGLDVIHDFGLGWYAHLTQSHDGSRLAMWDHRLRLLPPWMRPLKQLMTHCLPRYADFRRVMARQFASAGPTVVAMSQMCVRHYQQYHGVPREKIRLIHHGVDTRRFSPENRAAWREPIRERLGVEDDELLVLFVGHDYRRKGLSTAISAVRRLTGQGVRARLLVVGGYGRCYARSCELARCREVILLGPIDDPRPYYAAADTLVLPSFYDPFGLVVLEAAAAGLPCVASRFAGASELLSDGVDGWVLDDPADPQRLADHLTALVDPATRSRMGQTARRMALEHDHDRNCEEIIALYHELAGQRRLAA